MQAQDKGLDARQQMIDALKAQLSKSGTRIWGVPRVPLFGGLHNKDYSILGSILGSPHLGKLASGDDARLDTEGLDEELHQTCRSAALPKAKPAARPWGSGVDLALL